MTCISLDIEIPPLPPLFVPGLVIPGLPLPIEGDFCCKFILSNPAVVQTTLLAINAALAETGGVVNAVLGMIEAEVMALAEPILQAKLALSVSCPFNDLSTDDI